VASIKFNISEEEKVIVFRAIGRIGGKISSVAKIAEEAGTNPNRTRFIIEDLVEEGRVIKTVVKTFNSKYTRYTYTVVRGVNK
jgi:predicted transcriptional regulator